MKKLLLIFMAVFFLTSVSAFTYNGKFTTLNDTDDEASYHNTGVQYHGNSFLATSTGTADTLGIWLKKAGTPTNNTFVYIANITNNESQPSLNDMTLVATFDTTALTTSFIQNNISFNIATYPITSGNYYYFALSGGGTAGANTGIMKRNSGEVYPEGGSWFYDGGSWTSRLANYDINFIISKGSDVTLNAPVADYETFNTSVIFNCSTQSTSNILNLSLFLDGVLNETITNSTLTGNLSLEKQVTNLPNKEFNWTCVAVDESNNIDWGFNKTITTGLLFTENSQTFSNSTVEGSTENFTINISYDTGEYPNAEAYLVYNDTRYLGTQDGFIFTREIEIPSVGALSNVSFYWQVLLNNGSINELNSTTNIQSVGVLAIDDCSSYTNQLFNFTLYDEDTQALLVGGTDNTSMKIIFTLSTVDGGLQILNYSNDFNLTNPARVCFQNDLGASSYILDGIVEYSSLSRFTEFYHFQDYSLTNLTSNLSIALYNLNSTKGEEYKITYKDSNFVPIEGAVMNIQRKYVDEGVFKTTEIPKTGAEGYTIAHLVSNDVIYNIIILKDGVVLDTFTDLVADCQNPLLTSCAINLNSFTASNLPSDFRNYNDISFTLTYNRTTRNVQSIYTITTGVSAEVVLNVTLFDALGNTTVCSDSLTSSGGTLSCAVPTSFGNSSVIATIYKDGDFVGQTVVNLNPDPTDIYGGNIILIALLVFLTFAGMGASSDNPMAMGISLVIGSIVMIALNILYTPSWVGAGATFLWFIIAIVIVLVKGGSRQ